VSDTPYLDECNANYAARLAREEAEEQRVIKLEVRILNLECRILELEALLATEKGGWAAFYSLRCWNPAYASQVADVIWPDHSMKPQGAGAAASRILKRLERHYLMRHRWWASRGRS